MHSQARRPPPHAASQSSRQAQRKTARPRTRASALVPSAGGSHEKPVRFDAARRVTTSSQRARPSAIRVASRPRRQPEPRVSTPGIGDEARSCGLNQGAPAGWLSIVCLGDIDSLAQLSWQDDLSGGHSIDRYGVWCRIPPRTSKDSSSMRTEEPGIGIVEADRQPKTRTPPSPPARSTTISPP